MLEDFHRSILCTDHPYTSKRARSGIEVEVRIAVEVLDTTSLTRTNVDTYLDAVNSSFSCKERSGMPLDGCTESTYTS